MSLKQQAEIIIRQATVIAEAVYGIQLLIKKGIITREELLELRKTLIHADSILSPGSSIQSKDAGSDVDSSGSGESGISGESSDRGDNDCDAVQEEQSFVSAESEQGDTDSSSSKGQIQSIMIGMRYKCVCMDERVDLQVPSRAPAVDIIMWLDDIIMPRVIKDHKARSPLCREKTMEEILLPAPDGYIGSK